MPYLTHMNHPTNPSSDHSPVTEHALIAERRAKLAQWQQQGLAWPNDFQRTDWADELQKQYADAVLWSNEHLQTKIPAARFNYFCSPLR